MNKSQADTWELLLILGLVLLFVSPVGQWLGDIISVIATSHKINMSLNPFDTSSTTTNTTMIPGGNNALVGHYTIPLAGGGAMTVNANSLPAAIENVQVEGGTPATA